MILILLSLASLLFSSLMHDCCSPQLSCLIEENNNHVWERRTTNVSEKWKPQLCLREENNNHVWERTTIMYERGEQ
jgi:hypothetical protein